ncbi:MAG: chromate resistance protein ChrB domain-containing protein [Pseudomonadota bacterium]|jgi:rhodanese-related sulfurtransferase
MENSVSPAALLAATRAAQPGSRPLVIDVRRAPVFADAPDLIAGALCRDPADVSRWMAALPPAADVVVYCVHGHQVSQGVAQALREAGWKARFLDHGLEGWREAGGPVVPKPAGAGTRWVTRARPKIDRIACPWLIRRFVDPGAGFLYVETQDVQDVALAQSATPYDVAGAAFGHHGERCSFDAFVEHFGLGNDPAMARLATIVRAADTGHPEGAAEAAGLHAMSTGLSRLFPDDLEMLERAMILYDALYAACRTGLDDARTWRIEACR